MFGNFNTVTQGTVGVGAAVFDFTMRGWCVSIPINDIQSYDLVLDKGDGPKRVQIKTTQYKKNGSYIVQLKSVRPNRTENKIYRLDRTRIDYLYVLCDNGDRYLVPSESITGVSAISLGKAYAEFKLESWQSPA